MINLIDVDGGFLNIRLDARHFVALFLKALCHNELLDTLLSTGNSQSLKNVCIFKCDKLYTLST